MPYDYTVAPDWTAIAQAVAANRGSLWLIGNEMDRRDWAILDQNGTPVASSGQDEILPETYALAYHGLYTLIKSVDPAARVAVGGVIQATPLRLEYLTKAWNEYQRLYGAPMPVDVWNVHNFILKERKNDYGAGIPPGSAASTGTVYPDERHADMAIFEAQIRAFRQWMKDRGQQNKPLIVTEYGILYSHAGMDNLTVVRDFVINTSDFFLHEADCSLGYASDGCRLVQRWAWYSLDDDGIWTGSNFNEYGALYNAKHRVDYSHGRELPGLGGRASQRARSLIRPGVLPMRIALTVHKFPPESLGGTEVYTWGLARALASRGP